MEQKLPDQINQTPKNLKEFITNVQNSLDEIEKQSKIPFKVRKPPMIPDVYQLMNSVRGINVNIKEIEKRLDEIEGQLKYILKKIHKRGE